ASAPRSSRSRRRWPHASAAFAWPELRPIAAPIVHLRFSSPIPVGAGEEVPDIAADGGVERREARIVAGAMQVLDRGLREILIGVADRDRHVDVFDVGLPAERC